MQYIVLALIIHSGLTFYLFVKALEQGIEPTVYRPPSVEAFLPIGGLMSLKLFITTGVLDPIHPAAPIILTSAIVVSFLMRKSFCSWVCPIGTISELAWKLGVHLLGKNYKIYRPVDYVLRSLKYLLFGFFAYVILWKMSTAQITEFLNTPYWKVADIKMLKFFTEMTRATAITLTLLLFLSIIYKNFWCRYLCPYGAMVGLLGIFSPMKITRNKESCISCGRCAKNCPSLLPVDRLESPISPECTGCFSCVDSCPKKDALAMRLLGRYPVDTKTFAIVTTMVFFGILLVARFMGYWQSSLTNEELRLLLPRLDEFAHP